MKIQIQSENTKLPFKVQKVACFFSVLFQFKSDRRTFQGLIKIKKKMKSLQKLLATFGIVSASASASSSFLFLPIMAKYAFLQQKKRC